ncbi:hypothetical protein P5775_32335, partial [Bacillus cereus]|nr:hypothetical protein [Bacillus cereus]
MDKSWSSNSAQLLQEIDWKMSKIESILQQVYIDGLIEDVYEIHEMLIKVSQLLLTCYEVTFVNSFSPIIFFLMAYKSFRNKIYRQLTTLLFVDWLP